MSLVAMTADPREGGAAPPPAVAELRPERKRDEITSVMGLVVFMGSWAMMFAALFFAYALLRSRAPTWPPPGFERLPLTLPAISSVVIVISSLTMHASWIALRRGQAAAMRWWLGLSFGLGLAFLVVQAVLWRDLAAAGLHLTSGAYSAFFYVLTIFHAAHVLVGLALVGWLLPQARRAGALIARPARLRVVGLFWHFVGVVWLLIFLLVFVS